MAQKRIIDLLRDVTISQIDEELNELHVEIDAIENEIFALHELKEVIRKLNGDKTEESVTKEPTGQSDNDEAQTHLQPQLKSAIKNAIEALGGEASSSTIWEHLIKTGYRHQCKDDHNFKNNVHVCLSTNRGGMFERDGKLWKNKTLDETLHGEQTSQVVPESKESQAVSTPLVRIIKSSAKLDEVYRKRKLDELMEKAERGEDLFDDN